MEDKSRDSGNLLFESLFKLQYEPFHVDPNLKDLTDKPNTFTSVFQAVNCAGNNTMIKLNTGVYSEKLQLRKNNIRIQGNEPTTNAIIVNEQFPSITVDLPTEDSVVYLESLKLAHICESSLSLIKHQSLREFKKSNYRGFKTGPNMNTHIIVKKGILKADECRISLGAYKDVNCMAPCIVVEKEGTLIMTRSEIKGSINTIGIVSKGGKIVIKECNFRNHGAMGIFSTGNSKTGLIIKNSVFLNCNQGIVLNGPFEGSIESNIISGSVEEGILSLSGNSSKILNNEVKECGVGIKMQNSSPLLMKNIITKNTKYGVEIISQMSVQCWPHVKFNQIDENEEGGVRVSGNNNKVQLFNNEVKFNNKIGIIVEGSANPHIFLNEIIKTLGIGVHVCPNSTAFIEKNKILGSLKSNILVEGPGNVGNYIYNNVIQGARAEGIFVVYGEKFLIANNQIAQNFNGILSVTSVVTIERNNISHNESNGVILVDDNEVKIIENEIEHNKAAGVLCRASSRGTIHGNLFTKNKYELVVGNDHELMETIEQDNTFKSDPCDIRIPKNYICQLI